MSRPPISANMDINAVLQYLPHRYPFVMIDRVVDFYQPEDPNAVAGRRIKCLKNVTINEPFFPGHFPHRPVMPGVMQIEAMAQCCALACYTEKSDDENVDVLIVGINDARFRKTVLPGDTIIFECEVLKYKTRMAIIDCKGFVDGEIVSQATIKAALG